MTLEQEIKTNQEKADGKDKDMIQIEKMTKDQKRFELKYRRLVMDKSSLHTIKAELQEKLDKMRQDRLKLLSQAPPPTGALPFFLLLFLDFLPSLLPSFLP